MYSSLSPINQISFKGDDENMNIESFQEAFHTGTGSCRGECECKNIFYNSDGGWDWEDGELEALEADPMATDIDCTVSFVEFQGIEYVYHCECWHRQAEKIMEFLDKHSHGIANYLTKEKQRVQAEADHMPEVGGG